MSEGGDLSRDDYYSMTYGNQITPMPLFYNLVLSVFPMSVMSLRPLSMQFSTRITEYLYFPTLPQKMFMNFKLSNEKDLAKLKPMTSRRLPVYQSVREQQVTCRQ